MKTPTPPKRISIPEVAAILGVKYQVARDKVLEGTFGVPEQHGRQWTVERAKVMAWKTKNTTPTEG